MKIGIDRGHNCPPDTGASGIKNEDPIVKELGDLISDKLEQAGHDIIDCCPGKVSSIRESLNRRCQIANAAKCDLYISLHCNASEGGLGHGTEVFAISDAARTYAKPVVDAIASLGFRNRGVKSKNLAVLRLTSMPAILIEFFFIDNENDCELADKLGLKLIANTVVKALLSELK